MKNNNVRLWKQPELRHIQANSSSDRSGPAGSPVLGMLQEDAVHGGNMYTPLLTLSVNCDTMVRGTCGGAWTWGCCPK